MSGDIPRVVRAVAEAAASGAAAQQVIEMAMDVTCSELGFSSAALYRCDHERNELKAVAFRGFGNRVPERLTVFPFKRAPSMARLCAGETDFITHTSGTPELGSRFAKELGLPDIRWVFLPLRGRGGVVGVAGFIAGGGGPEFPAEHFDAFEVLSYQLGAMLLARTSHGATQSTIQRLQEDVRSSHAMLRAAEAMAEKADLEGVLEALASVVHTETGRYTLVTMISKRFSEITVASRAGDGTRSDTRISMAALDPVLKQSLVERRSAVIETGSMPSALGMPSGRFLSIPLVNDGALIGNIEVDDPPTDEAELAREIRVLQGVAFEAGTAIANARLYEQQRRSAGLREALNDINTMLNESIERPDLLQPVVERAIGAFPAEGAVLALLKDDHWVVECVAGTASLEQGDDLPSADIVNAELALKAGAPVLRPEAYADLLGPHAAQVTGIVMVVPLGIRKRHFGAMFFRRADWSRALDSETLDFATKLGSSVSLTMGNRYLYEHEHRVSETLQQALLSMPDSVPGVRLSHLYLAATERTRVGGDFYDAFEVPGGDVALVIGDVSGKGLDAAALTALVKNALKAHLMEGLAPAEALEKTNRVLYKFSSMETFVTVFAGVLNPESGAIIFANGGHLPPIVFSKEEARMLEADGALLGAFSESRYQDCSGQMSTEDTLLLYTDGLTEARSATGELYGEERLMQAVSKLHRTKIGRVPADLMKEVEQFTASGLNDDVAILALRLDKHGWRLGL